MKKEMSEVNQSTRTQKTSIQHHETKLNSCLSALNFNVSIGHHTCVIVCVYIYYTCDRINGWMDRLTAFHLLTCIMQFIACAGFSLSLHSTFFFCIIRRSGRSRM